MSKQTFPVFVDQPGCTMRNFAVTGASVSSVAPSTAGLDGRGQFLCTISKASNVVTVLWNTAFGDVPYIVPSLGVGQTNTVVEIVSSTAAQFVYQTLECDDNTAAVNDANVSFLICSYNTTSFVS